MVRRYEWVTYGRVFDRTLELLVAYGRN